MKSFLMLIAMLGSQTFAFASTEPTNFEKEQAAIEGFVTSPKVEAVLEKLEIAGDASAVILSKVPADCSVVETYFVAQPVEELHSPGWTTVKGTIELEYNTCSHQAIQVRNANLVELKGPANF